MHNKQDQLTLAFSALSDPTRRAILARLARGDATVKELASPFRISAPAITRHLKVLERAGLISRGKEAQWRPCRIEAEGFKGVADWVEEYREFWEASLDRLGEYLASVSEGKTAAGTKKSLKKGLKKGIEYGKKQGKKQGRKK